METNNLQKNNEIDLLDLLKKGGKNSAKLCQFIGNILGVIILFFLKKLRWLALFVIIGVAVAVSFYKTSPRIYSSMMMVRTNVLDNTFMINQVTELGQIRDTLTLANILDIPDTTAKHIVALDAFYGIATPDGVLSFIDTKRTYRYEQKDSTRYRIPGIFYVQVKTDNEHIFGFIGNKIIRALTNNPYVISHNDLRLEQLRGRLVEVNHQLRLLDSVQQTDYFKKQEIPKFSLGELSLVGSNERDRQLYHEQVFNMQSTKLSIEASLADLNAAPLNVMRDFVASSTIDNSLTSYLRYWVPVFFLLGLCFVVALHFRKKIWQLIKED